MVQPGPHNDAMRLDDAARALPRAGPVVAHFRSEQAKLAGPDERSETELLLAGRIAQASYPGGFWRYAVAVGGQQFLVDDHRRLAVGEAVRIRLPAHALHLYPVEPA